MPSEDLVNSLADLSLGSASAGQDARELGTETPRRPKKPKRRRRRRATQIDGTITPTTAQAKGEEDSTKGSTTEKADLKGSLNTGATAAKTATQQANETTSQESAILGTSGNIRRPRYLYVIQVRANNGNERIVGAFTKLADANNSAIGCVARYGITATQIVDTGGLFGRRLTTPGLTRASLISWANGTSEIHSNRFEWIKVLPKEWSASADSIGDGTVYLALDRTFVIGAYGSMDEAWEACKHRWAQLSYWTTIEVTKWVDKRGMFHGKGKILDQLHHWYVAPFPINVEVDQGERSA
ncbi:hypothetical protein B0J13DRAFT_555998 [Dactylonectria estremocensis]|uniref:Uncharacterized protein n=1 Tax=Dactylonectria estremocensis TaxID=1079267 RepID=A0A9P9EMZ3_9HYPO|nr:hypothetical protein B0J13DRAFT_555998 [Dactylonectria estremocensis]